MPTEDAMRDAADRRGVYDAYERAYLSAEADSDDDEEEENDDDGLENGEEVVGGGRVGYVYFDPSINRYSSFRVFGTPEVLLEFPAGMLESPAGVPGAQ